MAWKIKFIRFIYVLGIIIDGFWVFPLAIPAFFKIVTGNPDLNISTEFYTVLLLSASLMLGWTILLFWGYKKPLERRFIMILTAVPVVAGIFIASLRSALEGNPMSILFASKTFIILILYLLGYYWAHQLSRKVEREVIS